LLLAESIPTRAKDTVAAGKVGALPGQGSSSPSAGTGLLGREGDSQTSQASII